MATGLAYAPLKKRKAASLRLSACDLFIFRHNSLIRRKMPPAQSRPSPANPARLKSPLPRGRPSYSTRLMTTMPSGCVNPFDSVRKSALPICKTGAYPEETNEKRP